MPRTTAEIEKMLESEPKLTQMSCQNLCEEQANDLDILDNLQDFPANKRAQIRASILRSLQAIRLELKQQKCPPCTD